MRFLFAYFLTLNSFSSKVKCLFPTVIVSILSHVEFGVNYYQETYPTLVNLPIRRHFAIRESWVISGLSVVQTQAILFLKSVSERVGSDIQRLWNWMMNFYISTKNRLKMVSFKFIVVLCRIRPFPTLISKIKWLWSELPLIWANIWRLWFQITFLNS